MLKIYVGNFWCFPTWIFFFFFNCWVFPFRIRDSGFFHSFCFGHMRWLPEASRSLEDPHSILRQALRDTRKDCGCGHRAAESTKSYTQLSLNSQAIEKHPNINKAKHSPQNTIKLSTLLHATFQFLVRHK